MLNYRSADTLFRRASGTVACVSVLALTAIVLFLLAQGLPIFKDVPIGDFLFTTDWYPTDEPPVFGLGAMIVGSFAAAVLTAVIAVPLGVLTAAALHCAVPAWAARILKPVIELMAALPSVVIGFIGMVIVAPWLQETFNLPTGLNLFNAGLMPNYLLVNNTLRGGNTIWAVIIPNAMSAWYVILMRSYFENSIPAELFEASEIDGRSVYRQHWSITLPLSGPIFAVIALYTAVDIWISYFDSLIDINDKSTFPLQLALRNILIPNSMDMTRPQARCLSI